MFRKFIFLFLFLFTSVNLFGQQVSYLNVSDGLSSRHTYGIEQDKKGFIWIATNEGIDRYDGSEFKSYSLNSSSILPSDLGYRFNITTDTSKIIWAYTTSGKIFKYNEYTDAFELTFDLNNAFQNDNWRPYVFTLFIDTQNRIWIGTTMGIFFVDANKTDLVRLSYNQSTYAFGESEIGKIWAGTDNGVINIDKSDYVGTEFITDIPINAATKNIQVRSLFYDKAKQQLWIGSDKQGPSVYDFAKEHWNNLQHLTPNIPIRSIQKNLKNQIIIGLDGAGIVLIHPNSYELISKHEKLEDNQFGLSDNSVLDVFCDKNGKIWVSTWSEGISILDLQKPGIKIIKHLPSNINSLKNNNVNSIIQDSDGDLWFGTNNGISILEKSGKWSHLSNIQKASKISNHKTLALCEDNQKRIWIGGYANGLHCYDKKTKRLINYSDKIGNNHVYSIYYDKKNVVWFGLLDGNLTSLNLTTMEFNSIPINNTTCIEFLNDDELWVGGTTGLHVLSTKTNTIKRAPSVITNQLSNHYVNSIYQDENKNLWIGTNGGGLNVYYPENDCIEVFSVEHGLPSNFVYSIVMDEDNRIWLSTDKGICCFDPKQKVVMNTGKIQGLTDSSFNRNASEKTDNGDFIFGSSSGAICFNPKSINVQNTESKLVFNDFKISYRTVKPSSKKSPLNFPIDETETINLKHNQNSFSFNFSSINFDNSDQLVYRWKLDGFETDWSPLRNIKMAGYTNIPSGDYIFNLECVNRNDLNLSDSRLINISIAPIFWKTRVAYFFYSLLFLALVLMFYKIQHHIMLKQHSENKIKFFINTAHDIKTPLSLIKAPLKNIESDKGLTKKGLYFLNLAQANTIRLSAIVNQVLDFDKYDSGKFKLSLQYHNLNSYLEDKVKSYKPLAQSKDIKLKLKLPKTQINVEFDVTKMDKIMDNLISNAIKYTPENGNIQIIASEYEKEWILEVKDDGIGIPKKSQKDLFKLYFRADNAINSRNPGSGIGLMLTKKLVKMHRGKITFSSQEGKGSKFRLCFPKTHKNKYKASPIFINNEKAKTQNPFLITNKKAPYFKTPNLDMSSKKLLIVDDDPEMLEYLQNSLESHYMISTASDGEMALQMIEAKKFDLIISDVMMPKLRGDALCRKIKGNIDTSHLPVILLTALSDKINTISGLEAGADNYVNKPFDIEVIHARIENIFKNRSLFRDRLLNGVDPTPEKVSITNLDQEFIQKLMNKLNEEISNPDFTINDLCRIVGMSRTLLYEKIKSLTNLAPNEFIRSNKMNKALELLKSGQYNINEVGFKVGYQDSKYFSTAFKKFFGKSPKNYLPKK